MIKRCFSNPFIALAFLIMMLFNVFMVNAIAESDATPIVVPDDSVLNLIPQESLGLIYCPSLSELNHRINMMASDLMPQMGQSELLAKILAGAFGAGFQSLDELKKIGLDLNKDFAIFFTNLKPMQVSATVHIIDPEAIKQVIADEAEGSAPTEYNGETYWSTTDGSGNFAILDNILVFSQQPDVCKNVIDTRNGTKQAITHNPDYGMFLTDILKGTDQLGIYFDIEAISVSFGGSVKEGLESITEYLEDEAEPLSMTDMSVFENAINSWTELIEQLTFVSATLKVQETDLQLKPFLKFKTGSEFLKELKETSSELPNIGDLSNRSIINGTFQGVPKLLGDISTFWYATLLKDISVEQKQSDPFFQEVKAFYESLADKWSLSVNFENFILPNYLFVYELNDEQSAKSYMDGEFLKKLKYKDAYAGKPIMHNGIEIKNYIFANLGMDSEEMSPELMELVPGFSELIPSEWHWYYAFTDGQLFWSTGTSVEPIKMALDRKSGKGDKFSSNPSYQKLVDSLGTENNIFLAISPIIGLKSFFPLIEKSAPSSAASMQMVSGIFATLPDNYSIGLSAKVQNNGIDSNILLSLGDFKQLILMFGMLFAPGQMQ